MQSWLKDLNERESTTCLECGVLYIFFFWIEFVQLQLSTIEFYVLVVQIQVLFLLEVFIILDT